MASVTLFAYDLSRGMARQMSAAWTGRQFDAIWHTSVVYNHQIEVFYGQGILTCTPGQSHHGTPLKRIDMGTTQIDRDTFLEYIEGLREVWTAERYHLLEMNCNNFSNEVTSFLTNRTIPQDIIDLPKDFLATPFGASMRPMIDSMFRGGPALPPNGLMAGAESTLTDVASSAYRGPSRRLSGSGFSSATTAVESLSSPLTSCTDSASFDSILKSHRCVIANFTNERGCPPCRAIAPTFGDLAHRTASEANEGTEGKQSFGKPKKGRDAAFVKVDSGTSQQLYYKFGVRATPTFKFFVEGQEIGELKGANPSELKTQVDLTLYTAYPPHPHARLRLPSLAGLRPSSIRYEQTPNLVAALDRLHAALDACGGADAPPPQPIPEIKSTFASAVLYLQNPLLQPVDPMLFERWCSSTVVAGKFLPLAQLFPAVDFLRVGALQSPFSAYLASQLSSSAPHPLLLLTSLASGVDGLPRPFALTLARLLSNALATPALAAGILSPAHRGAITAFLVKTLLAPEADVRTTGASLAWGVVGWHAAGRTSWIDPRDANVAADEDWEVEVATALLEALSRESDVEVVHRLVATIGLLFYLSPCFESSLQPLAEALGTAEVLARKGKLLEGRKDARLAKELESLIAGSSR